MISIILPNYNTPVQFLEERIQSILKQTTIDWECIVIDGFSTNGSWEKLQQYATKDSRFYMYQSEKRGPYDAWNRGIKKANGEYVYIATSDDTMQPQCLELLSQALNDHSECDIAHCNLTIIDENSKPVLKNQWELFWTARYFGQLLNKKHIRLAPHDGILHLGVQTVYTSITQLLIRKSVFDSLGYFLTDCGPIADFEWGMRVSLLKNTIHIPLYLATWRQHHAQLTTSSYNDTALHRKNLIRLAKRALDYAKKIHPEFSLPLNPKELLFIFENDKFRYELADSSNLKKMLLSVIYLFKAPQVVISFIKERLFQKHLEERVDFMKSKMNSSGLNTNIVVIQ